MSFIVRLICRDRKALSEEEYVVRYKDKIESKIKTFRSKHGAPANSLIWTDLPGKQNYSSRKRIYDDVSLFIVAWRRAVKEVFEENRKVLFYLVRKSDGKVFCVINGIDLPDDFEFGGKYNVMVVLVSKDEYYQARDSK